VEAERDEVLGASRHVACDFSLLGCEGAEGLEWRRIETVKQARKRKAGFWPEDSFQRGRADERKRLDVDTDGDALARG